MADTNILADQLADVNRLENNSLSVLQGFSEVVTGSADSVTFTTKNADGTTTNATLPTNGKIGRDVSALQQSFTQIVGNSGDIIVSLDGGNTYTELQMREYKTSQPAITDIQNSGINVVVGNMDIEKLVTPATRFAVTLPSAYSRATDAKVRKVKLVTKLDASGSEIIDQITSYTYEYVIGYLESKGYSYELYEGFVKTEPYKTRYSGSFDVLTLTYNNDGTTTVQLSSKKYSDDGGVVTLSRELAQGDIVVTAKGDAVFIVTKELINNTFILTRQSGFGVITTGAKALEYQQAIDTSVRKLVNIPVSGGERSIIYVSTINNNTGASSPMSLGIPFKSSAYTVLFNGFSYTFDTFFASKCTDVGSYITSLTKDATINAADGIVPPKPTAPTGSPYSMSAPGFNIVQTNGHITSSIVGDELKKAQAKKQTVSSQINQLNSKISEINARIQKGGYKSQSEQDRDTAVLQQTTNQKALATKEYEALVLQINSTASTSNISNTVPLYALMGFFPVTEPVNADGTTQRIVQYHIRYKKVALDNGAVSSLSVNMDGQSGIISPWVDVFTTPLKKYYDTTQGKYVWPENNISSSDVNNINQVEIPVVYGEGIEFQWQAISEAGYPSNPLVSPWSDIVRINYDKKLSSGDQIKDIVSTNADDLVKVEINNILQTQGITAVASKSFTEKDQYFTTDADSVYSGFRTSDSQAAISLKSKLLEYETSIKALTEIITRKTLLPTIDIYDPANPANVVSLYKYATAEVFAGYYTDIVDITNAANYGTIAEKTFYLRIANNNAQPMDIQSLYPGQTSSTVSSSLYADSVLSYGSLDTVYSQTKGQILYMRSKDLTGNDSLISTDLTKMSSVVSSNDIKSGATQDERTIVQRNSNGTFDECAIISTPSLYGYVCMLRSHPAYVNYKASATAENLAILNAAFDRIAYMNSAYKANDVSPDKSTMATIGYSVNDKYLIGNTSLGARAYIQPVSSADIQVSSSDNNAAKTIQAGTGNALLIPIKFQYRMVDALGYLDGQPSLSLNAGRLEYRKKLGVDLLVNGERFIFDIVLYAKFRPDSLSANNIGIQSSNVSAFSTVPNIN